MWSKLHIHPGFVEILFAHLQYFFPFTILQLRVNLHPCQMRASPPFCVVIISIAIDDTYICGYKLYLLNTVHTAQYILALDILGLDILGITRLTNPSFQAPIWGNLWQYGHKCTFTFISVGALQLSYWYFLSYLKL